MVSTSKKIYTVLIASLLAIISINSTEIKASDVSLSIPSDSFSENSHLEKKSSFSNSALQGYKYVCSAVKSGASFVRKNAKVVLTGLALLPGAEAFTVSNYNAYGLACPLTLTTATCSIFPMMILNASATDMFTVSIRQSDLTVGTLGTRGKSKVMPSIGNGFWNVTGSADDVNALTSLLYFTNNDKLGSTIYLYPEIKNLVTGEKVSGKINFAATVLDATNLPQFKNYTGQVTLDPIVVKDTLAPSYKVNLSLAKEAGTVSFPGSSLTINMTDDINTGMYSRTYSASGTLSQINAFLGNVRCSMAKDYIDFPLGILIVDYDGTMLYNVVLLTSTTPPTLSTATILKPTSTSSKIVSTSTQKTSTISGTAGLSQVVSSSNTKSDSSALSISAESSKTSSMDTIKETFSLSDLTSEISSPNVSVPMTDVKLMETISSPNASQLPIIIGGAVAGVVLVAGVIVTVIICRKKKDADNRNIESHEPHGKPSQYGNVNLVREGDYNIVQGGVVEGQYDLVKKVNNYDQCDDPFTDPAQYETLPRNPVQYDQVLPGGENHN